MDFDPILIQASISLLLALGFVIYTLARRDRTQLHLLAAALVTCVCVWMTSLLMRSLTDAPAARELALFLEHLSGCANAALFLMTMGRFTRHPSSGMPYSPTPSAVTPTVAQQLGGLGPGFL